MGFLSGLFGGSKSTQTSSSASGYSGLPSSLRTGFDNLGKAVASYTDPNDPANVARFTPIPQTASETQGYNAINQGFAPTQDSLNSDLSMLMNPYNDYVIGGVNNAANSDYSVLKQNASQTGQFGSNRQELGANDIELQRQNTIGSLLQGQYNQALGQVFNNLVPQRQQDAYNQINEGGQQRNLALQTAQAPIAALQAGTGMIAPFTAGGTSTGYSGSSTSPGILSGFASGGGGVSGASGALSTLGSLASLFSDIRLKENIEYIGEEKGHKIYEFKYKNQEGRYRGVMAQEIQETNPEAVIVKDGYLAVNYDAIGIEFKRV